MERKREKKNSGDNAHIMNLQKEYLLRNFTFFIPSSTSSILALCRNNVYEILHRKSKKFLKFDIVGFLKYVQRSKQILYNRVVFLYEKSILNFLCSHLRSKSAFFAVIPFAKVFKLYKVSVISVVGIESSLHNVEINIYICI